MNMPKKNDTKSAFEDVAELSSNEVDEIVEVCIASPMEGYPSKARRGAGGERIYPEDEKEECLWGIPVLIEGEPGIAKSARLKQLAKVVHVKARSLFASQHPPEDFAGALIPDGMGGCRQICPLPQVRELVADRGPAIIFLDEINGASPATQGAVQSFIHERVAGEVVMPGRIRIVAAQNPDDIATGGYALAPAVANRFIHIRDKGPTAEKWVEWLTGASKRTLTASLATIEDEVADAWPSVYPKSQALFAGFMNKLGSQYIHDRPQADDPRISRAWPSHRTWHYAINLYTTAVILEKSEMIRAACITAAVGEAASTAFFEYVMNANIPSPLEVLEGKYKIDTDRLDVVFAAYTGAVAFVTQRPSRADKEKYAGKAWRVIKNLFDAQLADMAVPAAQALLEAELGRKKLTDRNDIAAATEVLATLAKKGVQSIVQEMST